jgi:hypothetical protein
MLQESFDFVVKALEHCGLPKRTVETKQRIADELPRAPVAYVYWRDGRMKRDGSKITSSVAQTKQLWGGITYLRVELYLRDIPELEKALEGIARYFSDNKLFVNGIEHKMPTDEIALSWLDEMGVLVSFTGVTLDIPVAVGIYQHSGWTPIQVQLEETIIVQN